MPVDGGSTSSTVAVGRQARLQPPEGRSTARPHHSGQSWRSLPGVSKSPHCSAQGRDSHALTTRGGWPVSVGADLGGVHSLDQSVTVTRNTIWSLPLRTEDPVHGHLPRAEALAALPGALQRSEERLEKRQPGGRRRCPGSEAGAILHCVLRVTLGTVCDLSKPQSPVRDG